MGEYQVEVDDVALHQRGRDGVDDEQDDDGPGDGAAREVRHESDDRDVAEAEQALVEQPDRRPFRPH